MKIIEQSHEILSIPDGILETLERAGRTCYQSADRIGCTIKDATETCYIFPGGPRNKTCGVCPMFSSHQFVGMLIRNGHHAMIEFGDIIVKFITNRGVTHELVRHRMCSFAQESTRYVKYDGEMVFIKPVWVSGNVMGIFNEPHDFDRVDDPRENQFCAALWDAETAYRNLLSKDFDQNPWKAQQAREVLPNSLKTEIVVKANIREWRHIFSLRCPSNAHPQMYGLMRPLLAELQERVPVVFDDIKF